MANFRIPGPLNDERAESARRRREELVELVRRQNAEWYRRCQPGPLGCYSLEEESDREKSEPEFRVLNRFCVKGVGVQSGRPFADLDDYLDFRNDYFGSAEAYWAFARASDREFEEHAALLERLLPDPWRKRKSKIAGYNRWKHYLYRWIRKAYIKSGVPETEVPNVIKSGMTDELRAALQRVRATYSKQFRWGGFIPRPKKKQGGQFRLGTLSEHGTGTAVDVESARNPDLSRAVWTNLETYTGFTVDRSRARWTDDPQALWADINELNRLFVARLEREAEADWQEKKRAAEQRGETAPARETVKAEFKADQAKTLGLKTQYVDGFFTLEWDLVEAFHENDFLWGAVFSNTVDLHHFEL
jgi:hypothetical protein